MSRRRAALGVALGLLLLLAAHTGWGRGERPWREATGWDAIPEADRAPLAGALWEGGEAPVLTWLGHAGVVLAWRGVRVAVDPNLSPACTIVRRELEIPAVDVGALDAVLITHAHFDHLDRPTLAALPGVGAFLAPHGSLAALDGIHPEAPRHGVEVGDRVAVGALEALAVPAFHHGNRWHPLASRRAAVGWVLRSGGEAIYVAGDTGAANDFAAIRERFHPRVALLPIGAFAPAWPVGRVHLSPEQAVAVAQTLGVELVVPVHFGTFALALDRPATALPRFARAAAAAGLRWRLPALPGAAT